MTTASREIAKGALQ